MTATTGITPTPTATTPTEARLEKFFARVDPVPARVIFAIDATGSRQATWDTATRLTAKIFDSAAGVGRLDMRLVYYRGIGECVATRWFGDARSLATVMSGVFCRAGETQIERVLLHADKENRRQRVDALVLISDSCEEDPAALRAAARQLGAVPAFMLQEGHNERVARIYQEIARLTGGAVAQFDAGAADRLADLLRAVTAFATGGVKALAGQQNESARLLLAQVRK
jgi:hypothetical protein